MTAPKDFVPWWEKPNQYYGFEARDEFVAGAASIGYRVNSKQDAMLALISAGYLRSGSSIPKSHTGRSDAKLT